MAAKHVFDLTVETSWVSRKLLHSILSIRLIVTLEFRYLISSENRHPTIVRLIAAFLAMTV